MIKEFKLFEAWIRPNVFDKNVPLFGIPDQFDFTDEQRRSFEMLEKAYEILGKVRKYWGGEIRVDSMETDSKYVTMVIKQGNSCCTGWAMRRDGQIHREVHRYNQLSYWFYPESVRQIINVEIPNVDNRVIGLKNKLELLGVEIPKKKKVIKNKDVDPYGEEEWGDNGLLPETDRMYWIDLMGKVRFKGVDYID